MRVSSWIRDDACHFQHSMQCARSCVAFCIARFTHHALSAYTASHTSVTVHRRHARAHAMRSTRDACFMYYSIVGRHGLFVMHSILGAHLLYVVSSFWSNNDTQLYTACYAVHRMPTTMSFTRCLHIMCMTLYIVEYAFHAACYQVCAVYGALPATCYALDVV